MTSETTANQCVQVQIVSNVDLRRLQDDLNRLLAMGPAEDVVDIKFTVSDTGTRPTYTAMVMLRTERPADA